MKTVVVSLALLAVVAGGVGGDSEPPLPGTIPGRTWANAAEHFVDVAANRGARAVVDEANPAIQASTGREWDSIQSIGCTRGLLPPAPDVDGLCQEGVPSVYVMLCDPADWEAPRWRRYRDSGVTAWSSWEQIDYGTCPADRVPAMTAEDFRRLPLPPPRLIMQPEGDWVLVNIETIVLTDPTPVVLTTDLLGHQVEVEARPALFTYDFDDGSDPLVTRDPGRRWPDFTTHHVYEQPGTAAITLTTTWTGRYRLVGAQDWLDVSGTAQTSTTGPEFRIEERTSRLVDGLCTDRPKPPDC